LALERALVDDHQVDATQLHADRVDLALGERDGVEHRGAQLTALPGGGEQHTDGELIVDDRCVDDGAGGR
jgi:hypothetical protein